MTVGLPQVLVVGAALFCLGVYGALAKRNAVAILMGIELMLNGVNVSAVGISRFVTPVELHGQLLAIFIIAIAAAEAAVGLAVIIAVSRTHQTVNVDDVDLLRW
jgi:NADH:ubiquinone oxidoreductase subunit K